MVGCDAREEEQDGGLEEGETEPDKPFPDEDGGDGAVRATKSGIAIEVSRNCTRLGHVSGGRARVASRRAATRLATSRVAATSRLRSPAEVLLPHALVSDVASFSFQQSAPSRPAIAHIVCQNLGGPCLGAEGHPRAFSELQAPGLDHTNPHGPFW